MSDMERRKFEEEFRNAFKDGEIQPSDQVWKDIELDLMKADGEKMKRRILFYQILAAASVSFAILATGIGFYSIRSNERDVISQSVVTPQTLNGETPKLSSGSVEIATTNDESTSGQSLQDARPNGSDQTQASRLHFEGLSTSEPTTRSGDTGGLHSKHFNSYLLKGNDIAYDNLFPHGTDTPWNAPFKLNRPGSESNLLSLYVPSMEGGGNMLSGNSSPNNTGVDDHFTESGNNNNSKVNASTQTQFVAASQDPRSQHKEKLPELYEKKAPTLSFTADQSKSEADPVALMMLRLKDLEKELAGETADKKKGKQIEEKLWTSVSFAAGSFNAISPANGPTASPSFTNQLATAPTTTNSTVLNNQTKAPGVSYTIGISMGTRITDRLVLQGGVNYLTEMSDFTSTQAIHDQAGNFKAASVSDLRSQGSARDNAERFIPTAPYTVNSNNEYVSVPVQAGYLLIKKRFVWQFNAGVSTDLFLQNTIDPEGNIEKSTQSAGEESPYRTVNFSGLIGSEVSYRFGAHYRLGLSPGIRYPFSSIYKDDLGISSAPLTFDVGLRFRYIFH